MNSEYKVVEAKFLTSATNINQTPAPMVTEVVFVGRSNVGKSSLLNSLSNKKGLAKSSQTPGKTRLINFFDITLKKDDNKFALRFVDLPGFGYAKVSKSKKDEWQKNLTEFLLKRDSIRLYIQLIDSRHPDLKNDKEVSEFLKSIKRLDQQIFKVFTKTDKLKNSQLAQLKNRFKDGFFISNIKKSGIDTLRDAIGGYLFEVS